MAPAQTATIQCAVLPEFDAADANAPPAKIAARRRNSAPRELRGCRPAMDPTLVGAPSTLARQPRGVAQLVEHRSPKPRVAGSSPVSPVPSIARGGRGIIRARLFRSAHLTVAFRVDTPTQEAPATRPAPLRP